MARAYSNLEFDLATQGARLALRARRARCCAGSPAPRPRSSSTTTPPPCCSRSRRSAHGKEVIVSRGELIEIGGEFRIPDIMAAAGARAASRSAPPTAPTSPTTTTAIGPDTGAAAQGPHLATTASSASPRGRRRGARPRSGAARGIPVMEDLGSGSLVDLDPLGLPDEPTVPEVVAAGADLVAFTGDKLLGGPQAGDHGRQRPSWSSG